MSVLVIDTGCANIASVCFALQRLDAQADVTSEPARIEAAQRVIFPGVGAAKFAMQRLRDLKLVDVLRLRTKPTLGICLGMQLMFEGSDEDGGVEGLSIFKGWAQKFRTNQEYPVPHMGWSKLELCDYTQFMRNISINESEKNYTYFVHSYYFPRTEDSCALAEYGGQKFTAAAQKGPFMATQFHPERSAGTGAAILRNFLEMAC